MLVPGHRSKFQVARMVGTQKIKVKFSSVVGVDGDGTKGTWWLLLSLPVATRRNHGLDGSDNKHVCKGGHMLMPNLSLGESLPTLSPPNLPATPCSISSTVMWGVVFTACVVFPSLYHTGSQLQKQTRIRARELEVEVMQAVNKYL